MNAFTRRTLIIVCVLAFLLTSTVAWGVISASIDVADKAAATASELAKGTTELGKSAAQKTKEATGWTMQWIAAHGTSIVPVFFLVGIGWLVMQKPKVTIESPESK